MLQSMISMDKFFILDSSIKCPQILLIIVGSIIGLILIFVIFYRLVFEKKGLKKQIRELDSRFSYLHALLIGQDAQYVKRLEIISRTNLLYVEIHTKFLKKFKEVRDKHDSNAQSTINHLKDLADDKKFKILKEALVDAKDSIASYEREVNTLNNELLKVVKPEEECRQASLTLKERLRGVKQDYYAKQGDLQLVEESFDEIFKYIDSLFQQFEDFVESAQYDDANAILPKIEKIILEISNAMSQLPNLCAMVVSYIPDKISSLENAYEIMIQDRFPLNHLCVNSSIREMKNRINVLITRIKRFDLNGVSDELNDIVSRIEEFIVLFQEERNARDIFEKDNESTYDAVNTIERRFIKLCNTIPEVSKIFIINDEHQSKINSIQNNINKLGALKRSLDTFIHSSTKQPYSLLVSKMDELEDASKTVFTAMDEFSSYLNSLKVDSENAYHIIHEFFYKLKEAEKTVNDIGVIKINEKYASKFERCYELLNEVNKLLLISPIDVDKVNSDVKELQEIGNELFDNGSIQQDYNLMILAEKTILCANRSRCHLSDINSLVKQAETMFNEGEFEKSYITAGEALKKVTSVENDAR